MNVTPHTRTHTYCCSVDELAVGVRDALAALGHPRATLVGHSYGTLVASRFSKLFPEQVIV